MFGRKPGYSFILVLIYTLSHGMIMLISGVWWDDWTLWTNSAEQIQQTFWEAGVPWEAWNLFSVMWLGEAGYRVAVFLLFGITGVLFYKILCSIKSVSENDAFWMSAIAMCVPVNDARVTLICYGYTLSLCLFMSAFYIAVSLDGIGGLGRRAARAVSLLLLFYSYMTQSLLVFTGLIWLYFFCSVWIQNEGKGSIRKIMIFLKTYWDYAAAPFVFFAVKNIFFKPYGRYEGYNSVTLWLLFKGIVSFPAAAVKTFISIGHSYVVQIGILSVAACLLVAVIYLFLIRWKLSGGTSEKPELKTNVMMFFAGGIVYLAGVFPYIIIHGGSMLGSTGVGGRDAMLAGFGIGIMAVSFVRIFPVKKPVQNLILVLMTVLGIFHFNDWYLNYQEDWYHQLEFARAVEESSILPGDKTILCDFSAASPVSGTRFYSLNGMSYMVTGRMDRFYFSGISDLRYGVEFNEDFLHGCNADDYDPSDTVIDGIMIVNNAPVSNGRLLQMRFDEIFRRQSFEKDILAAADARYKQISRAASDRIYALYQDGRLTSDFLRRQVMTDE